MSSDQQCNHNPAEDSTGDIVNKNIAVREAQKKAEQQAKDSERCDKHVQSGLNRNVTIQFLIERLVNMGCPPPPGLVRCVDCGDKQAAGAFGVVEEIQLDTPTSKNILYKGRAESKKSRSCVQTQEEINSLLAAQREGKVKLKLLPDITLCQQHLRNETHAHEAMVHELIHAVDMCRYVSRGILTLGLLSIQIEHPNYQFFKFFSRQHYARTKMDPMNNCIHMACTEIRAENLSGECHWFRELM